MTAAPFSVHVTAVLSSASVGGSLTGLTVIANVCTVVLPPPLVVLALGGFALLRWRRRR